MAQEEALKEGRIAEVLFPGFLELGEILIGVLPLKLNLTSNLPAFYRSQRWDEAKLVVERSFGKRGRKRNAYKSLDKIFPLL